MYKKTLPFAVLFCTLIIFTCLVRPGFSQEVTAGEEMVTEYVGMTPQEFSRESQENTQQKPRAEAGTTDTTGTDSEWKGNSFYQRRHKHLKYDESGQVDASPEVKAMEALPRDKAGFVDWAAGLESGLLAPRDTLTGTSREEQTVLFNEDVTIKAKLKFMTDAVFPHKAHNKWLSCDLCHPKIFAMKAGGTDFTMAEIWKGEFCGRCHDKVAFPTRHCYRCHKARTPAAASAPVVKKPTPTPPPTSKRNNRRPVFPPRK